MDALKGVVHELQLDDRELIDQWYKKDENEIPEVYVLQPISSILANFNNKRVHRLMEKDQLRWWEIMEKLQKLLRKGVAELYEKKLINEEEMHDYIMSVTEREIRRGIIDASEPSKHCLAYIRCINNIDVSHNGIKLARNYVDMIGNEVDHEAANLLNILRDQLLPSRLPESNIAKYNVEWNDNTGIDIDSHSQYLDTFCNIFYRDVCGLIDKAAEEQVNYGEFEKLFTQVHHHQILCLSLIKSFSGRNEILEKIKKYLKSESTKPFILWGESGCGKTSILAKASSMLKMWLEEDSVEMIQPLNAIRFLGTSIDSSSVVSLLWSLSQQIYYFLNNSLDNNTPFELMPLVLHFKDILNRSTFQKPIFLFLDSLDQLFTGKSYNLAWCPFNLPKHCKLVISVPMKSVLTKKLTKLMGNEYDNFLEILSLGQEQGLEVVRFLLANTNRTLNLKQWKIVEKAIENCSEPLFLKILIGVVSKWKSYEAGNIANIAFNTHDAIVKLFEKTENNHGKILVSHAFGYITISKRGVTEAELEDLLSLDESVLNDVYQYHLPPVRRIPPLLWTRIRSDLSDYISEREVDGVNVINWNHNRFADVTKERYFKNLNVLTETHSLMADYFNGIWGGVSKPFQYSDLQCQRFELDSAYGSCDRKVSEQPLYFTDRRLNPTIQSLNPNNDKIFLRYNLRKLNEMPHQLIRSRRFSELYEIVLFNFKWLHAKLSAMSVQSLLEDFEGALSNSKADQQPIQLLIDSIKLSASVIEQHPDMLASQLIGRLIPLYSQFPLIQNLLKQCDTDGIALNALTPCYNCLQTPGGPLELSLEGHQFAPFGICITSDCKFLVSASNKFIVWNLNNMQLVRQSSIGTLGIVMQMILTADDGRAIAYTNSGQILIYTVLTGEVKLVDNDYLRNDEEIFGITTNNEVFGVWSSHSWFIFGLEGTLLNCKTLPYSLNNNANIVHLYLVPYGYHFLVWKYGYSIGVVSNIEMFLSSTQADCDKYIHDSFAFHSGIAMTKDRRHIFVCKDEDLNIRKFTIVRKNEWKKSRSFENDSKIYSIILSQDENILGAVHVNKFTIWFLYKHLNRSVVMILPKDVRNFPKKVCINETIVFCKENEFMLIPVRQILYVYETNTGTLINIIDAHFRRILNVKPICASTNFTHFDGFESPKNNYSDISQHKFITTSLDRSIKLWNLKFIREHVYNINVHEKQIEKISCINGNNGWIAVTTTRNCIGVWNLETGKMIKSLTGTNTSSIVTHSTITNNGEYILCVEGEKLIIWDAETFKICKSEHEIIDSEVFYNVLQIKIAPDDKHVIMVKTNSKDQHMAFVEKRQIPSQLLMYQIFFKFKTYKPISFTSDGSCIVVLAYLQSQEIIKIYSYETGERMSSSFPKYRRCKEIQKVAVMPNKSNRIALIDGEKGNIWDWRKKSLVRSIFNWSGKCSRDGYLGLTDPSLGALEIIDLKTGSIIRTLISRPAEGLHPCNKSDFTPSNNHVYFFHSAKQSIRLFRMSDGCKIADYKMHAEITSNIVVAHDSKTFVLGGIDGSLIILAINDPQFPEHTNFVLEKRKIYF